MKRMIAKKLLQRKFILKNKTTNENIEEIKVNQQNVNEKECTEGEKFERSNLDFSKFNYFEPFEHNLSLKGKTSASSLEDALKFFTKSEHLDDDYFCSHCDDGSYTVTSKAVKRLCFLKPPRNLIINIKRFIHTAHNIRKDSSRIKFPLRFSLDKYMIKEVLKNKETQFDKVRMSDYKPQDVYELNGVVCHSGGMAGGHYTCYVSYNTEEGKDWYGEEIKDVNFL